MIIITSCFFNSIYQSLSSKLVNLSIHILCDLPVFHLEHYSFPNLELISPGCHILLPEEFSFTFLVCQKQYLLIFLFSEKCLISFFSVLKDSCPPPPSFETLIDSFWEVVYFSTLKMTLFFFLSVFMVSDKNSPRMFTFVTLYEILPLLADFKIFPLFLFLGDWIGSP